MSAPQIEDAPDLGSITPPETIPQTGPAEPYPRAERWATVTALPNATEAGPIDPIDETEQAPETVPPGQTEPTEIEGPAPAEASPDPVEHVAPSPDPEPTPPVQPKESRWEKATSVGYWMSVSVGAAGQIFALASWMDIGWMKYIAAGMGAAFAEVAMIGASKRARNNRIAEHPKPWKLLLVIACVICGYATAMNFIHWLSYSVGMAVTFAGGSAVGFTVETTVEHIEAAAYERRKQEFEAEHRKWKARQARTRPASPSPAPSTPQKPSRVAKSRSTKASSRSGFEALTAEIVAYAQEHSLGARDARNQYRATYRPRGVPFPSEPTVKRALTKAKSAS